MLNKIKNAFLQFMNKLTGEDELRKVDKQLRILYAHAENEKSRTGIKRTRKILKNYYAQTKKKLQILMGVTVVSVLGMLGIGILAISGGSGSGKKQEVSSQKEEQQNQENTEEETLAEGEQAENSEPSEPVDILMTFTGDCILGTDENFLWDTGFNAYYYNYGGDYFMSNVRDIFEKDDLTIVNFEGTLTEETAREYKQFAFKGDPEFVDVLTTSSVEAANVANNHSHDYGEQSFIDTVNILEQNNIRTFGYDEVAVLEVKGVKIGFYGIYELDDHLERIPQLKANIQKLKDQGAQIIVGTFHWGNELEGVPDDNELTLAHLAIDLGVDLVIGHHPHVLQGVEEYKGKYIAYSLGNFCFGGNSHPTEMDTMIFQQKFTVQDGKIIASEINKIPCCVSSTWEYNDYKPTVMEGYDAESILQKIQDRSDAIPKNFTPAEAYQSSAAENTGSGFESDTADFFDAADAAFQAENSGMGSDFASDSI